MDVSVVHSVRTLPNYIKCYIIFRVFALKLQLTGHTGKQRQTKSKIFKLLSTAKELVSE